MISLDNLTVSYGGWTLFDNISFLINPKDRIGLVGKNGAGKTTLLKLIVGEQQPTSGAVSKNGECTVGYLPQQMKVADTTTLVEETASAFKEVLALEAEIAALTRENRRAHRLRIARLRSVAAPVERRAGSLPHPRRRDARRRHRKDAAGTGFQAVGFRPRHLRVLGRLAHAHRAGQTAAATPLDLPAGRTDQPSGHRVDPVVGGVSEKATTAPCSSFRTTAPFWTNVTTRTVELSLGKIYDYKVPYSKYVVLRAERRAQQLAAYENQQRMIEKTEEFIEKFRYKPTKSNQVQSRIKQLERIERIEVDEEDAATLNIKFPPAPRSGQIVAEVKEAGMSFGANTSSRAPTSPSNAGRRSRSWAATARARRPSRECSSASSRRPKGRSGWAPTSASGTTPRIRTT